MMSPKHKLFSFFVISLMFHLLACGFLILTAHLHESTRSKREMITLEFQTEGVKNKPPQRTSKVAAFTKALNNKEQNSRAKDTSLDNTPQEPIAQSGELESEISQTESEAFSESGPTTPQDRYLLELRQVINRLQTYPNASLAFKEQGVVKLRITLSPSGQLIKLELIEPSHYPRLNDAAMRAALKAMPFKPFPEDVQAQVWRITLPVRFSLI